MTELCEVLRDRFIEKRPKICNSLIREYQEETSDEYDVRKPTDDLKCVVCGGKFKRRDQSKHKKTKKHRKKLEEIYEYICK